MKTTILILIFTVLLGTISCDQNKSSKSTSNVQDEKVASNTKTDVPYEIADRYFIKNTVEEQKQTLRITSQSDFDKYFGSATVMGSDGKPTPIDFSKQYVIAIIGEQSDYKVSILPLSLESENNTITLQYKVETGDKQTYTSRALLILVIDNKYSGSIEFEEK